MTEDSARFEPNEPAGGGLKFRGLCNAALRGKAEAQVMNLRNNGGNFSAATSAGAPKPSAVCRALVAYILVAACIIAAGMTSFSQSPSPTPAKESDAVSENNVSAGQTEDQT